LQDLPKKRVRKTKPERQKEIAEAAIRLVGKYGVGGTTVSRIDAAVGLSKGSLYRHFRSREAVLLAALALMGERIFPWMQGSKGRNAMESLLIIGETHAAWVRAELETFVRPFYEFIAADESAALSKNLSDGLRRGHETLAELVEEGKRQGSIRPDIESGDVAWALLASAWAEDVALLSGIDDLISDGVSRRNIRRILASVAVDPSPLLDFPEQDRLGARNLP
jgi:AcrR family transcriptional regulator